MKTWLPLLLLVFVSLTGNAQSLIIPEYSRSLFVENYPEPGLSAPHTEIKPWLQNDFRHAVDPDSAMTPGCRQSGAGRSWIVRKLFFEHFLKADTADFYIAADPLFDFQGGYDLRDKSFLYRNTRGIQILGGIKGKLAFYTSYRETQERLPDYIRDYIDFYDVAPGMCRVKDFRGNAWDYGVATANISYDPAQFLNIQLGYGKNFFGNGYRSLLLSDNAFQYPFLKLSAKFGRFEYVSMFTGFQNIRSDSVLNDPYIWYAGYQKKGGTFNYFSMNVTKWLQIGLFEGIIWKAYGEKDYKFNANQFIPLIFVNSFRYSLFGENNIVLGLNVNARPYKDVHIYGQFVLDDFHFNKPAGSGYQKDKYGFQFGTKYFNAAGIKNLILQLEYNQASPYAYAHHDPRQSYTHNNQALAHPLGANFKEVVCFATYRYKRLYAGLQFNYAETGADTSGSHWGANIFLSDGLAELGYNSTGNITGQGVATRLMHAGLKAGYLFNPKYNLCVEGGLWIRNKTNDFVNEKSTMIWIGLRTNLFNQYLDF